MSIKKQEYPLNTIYLYISDQCNLGCNHCWISPRFTEDQEEGIPLDPLKKTILEAKQLGLQGVKLTGGEPLLYRDIAELLSFLSQEDVTVMVETNGTLISRALLESLQSCGVTQVSVSLDGARAEVHDRIRGVRGGFDRTLNGLRLLSEYDFSIQIIMTLQRSNSEEITGLIALSKELGADSLKINHLLPCGRGKEVFRKKQNLDPSELIHLYNIIDEDHSRDNDLDIIFDLPVAFRSVEDIKRRGINECRIMNILGILANGDFSICGIGQAYDRLRMGNIHHDSISDVWKKNPILNDLRDSLPGDLKGICGQCIFKFQCLGSCRANAYALEGDLYAPYFLCQESYRSGLFPSSRYVNELVD